MSYRCFKNETCAYYPCHAGIPDDAFHCLFCYCPLYSLGRGCGGAFRYDNPRGIKDCSDCTFPHDEKNYEEVVRRLKEVVERTKEGETEQL